MGEKSYFGETFSRREEGMLERLLRKLREKKVNRRIKKKYGHIANDISIYTNQV